MIVNVTEHAMERGRERFNLSHRSLSRMAQKAFEEGLHHEKTTKALREWALQHIDRGANHLRILGHQAFLFFDHHLITVLLVPRELLPRPKANRPKEEFEEEDREDDHNPPDIR